MILIKNKLGFCLSLVLFFCVLSGCNVQKSDSNYYLLLMGESNSWKLTGYEVVLTSDEFKAGFGKLNMKNVNEYNTDFFQFGTHMVVNDEDIVVHSGSATGGMDIAEETIGAIEGGAYLNENNDFITLDDVSEIYMMIEWRDIDQDEDVKERIDLYNKVSKEQTFLN